MKTIQKGKDNSFWKNQIVTFIAITIFSFLAFSLSSRTSLFSGGILSGLGFGYLFKLITKPTETILPGEDTKKVLSFWLIALIVYLLLFIVDNMQFRMAPLPEKYEEFELSEVIDDNFLYISNEDLIKLTKKDCFSSVYYVDGKYVFRPIPNDWFGIIEGGVLKTVDTSLITSGTAFSDLPIPNKLKGKNPRSIGITVDTENTPYFVYALLEKQHLFGKYTVKNYALWNALNKEIEYYDELPDFAKP